MKAIYLTYFQVELWPVISLPYFFIAHYDFGDFAKETRGYKAKLTNF